MEEKALEQLIQNYERLFFKVLQHCSIFPGQSDYEDHLQELRLHFYLRAKKYEDVTHFEKENDITYLFRHLMWRIVDVKRKRLVAVEEVADEVLDYLPMECLIEMTLEEEDQFQRFYQQLTRKDQEKCLALIENTASRQNKSRYRQYFRKNFQQFFEKV